MSLDYCHKLLGEADPARYSVLRAATDAAQAKLLPIYAINVEIGRAAWASKEPLVAEMRLQWWRDAIGGLVAGKGAQQHPALEAAGFLQGNTAAEMGFERLIEARRWDIWREPFGRNEALWTHLQDTAGELGAIAAQVSGATPEAQDVVRAYLAAAGLANWFQAVPELAKREIDALPDQDLGAIAGLAREGLARLQAARAEREKVPADLLPILLTGWQAEGLLKLAARDPQRVLQGGLELSEFARRGSLVWRALSKRW